MGDSRANRSSTSASSSAAALALSLGGTFAGSVAAGALLGWWIDRSLGWRPVVFTLVLGGVGAVGGFVAVVRAAGGVSRPTPDDDSNDGTRDT